jgi:hypothetical protein
MDIFWSQSKAEEYFKRYAAWFLSLPNITQPKQTMQMLKKSSESSHKSSLTMI